MINIIKNDPDLISDPVTNDSTFGIGLPAGESQQIGVWKIRELAKLYKETGKTLNDLTDEEKEEYKF